MMYNPKGMRLPYSSTQLPETSSNAMPALASHNYVAMTESSVSVEDQLHRFEMALASELSNEIDWALRELSRISCFADEQWHFGNFYSGLESLLKLVVDYVESTVSTSLNNCSKEIALFALSESVDTKRVRACNSLLIISNFCTLKNNALYCAGTAAVRQTVLLCRGLDSGSSLYVELIDIAGSTLESIAPYMHVSKLGISQDEQQISQLELHQQWLWQLHADALLSADYRRIISGANILRALAAAESHRARWLHAPIPLLNRFYELLLLSDGNVSLAVLELLLHLLNYGLPFVNRFAAANPSPRNFALLVSRYLRCQMNHIEKDFWLYHWDYNDKMNPFTKPYLERHHSLEVKKQLADQVKVSVPPIPDMFLDLVGLPYTAAVVLKRLASQRATFQWVKAIEHDLFIYLANPRLYGVMKEVMLELSRQS